MLNRKPVRVPGDKSITHRALMLASLADGVSRISGALVSDDTASTAAALRQMGCDVPVLDPVHMAVSGEGLMGLRPAERELDCGNSGTTARLLLGILSAQSFAATLTGDESLRRRPMRRVTIPLSRMGAEFRELGEADRLPLQVHGGTLRALEYESPHSSGQVKGALLLAGLCGGVPVRVREALLSRDHTERMLRALGVPVRTSARVTGGWDVAIDPVTELPALDVDVPGDFSAAAFLLAAGLLLPGEVRLENVGVNPTRTGLLPVLRRMGALFELADERTAGGEPVADIVAGHSPLRGTSVEPEEIPSLIDEVPILAVLAARAEGETVITGAAELKVKESDRIATMVENLRAVGVLAEALPDGLVVEGSDRPLRGRVRSGGDHRVAMAFGVLGALPGNEIYIDDTDIAAVSFPTFWETLRQLGRTA